MRLNGQRFSALKYSGPGTLTSTPSGPFADGHEWEGGASTANNGITCNANIPTEEVFTTPHARRVEGHVVSSKPLSYQGSLIDNIQVRFEGGRIVEARASKGEEVLNKVLDTDEGARRLGEVALVPHSSPISKSGLLFFNTLFDENAACHIALGQCYSKCFVDGTKLTPEQIAAQGGNKSLIHIDWMIGSDKLYIDGIHSDGRVVPVFRQGRVGLKVADAAWLIYLKRLGKAFDRAREFEARNPRPHGESVHLPFTVAVLKCPVLEVESSHAAYLLQFRRSD